MEILALAFWYLVIFVGGGFFTLAMKAVIPAAMARARTPSRPKILTPLDDPFGSTVNLIRWAEANAIRQHRVMFGDDGLSPEDLKLVLVEDFRRAAKTEQPTILNDPPGDGLISLRSRHPELLTPNEQRAQEGVSALPGMTRTESGEYQRYLKGIGLVTASTPERLNRACEVVLAQRFNKYELTLRHLDHRIAAMLDVPSADLLPVRAERAVAWQSAKGVIENIQALHEGL